MENSRVIWDYEVNQADKVARSLIETRRVEFGWRVLFSPSRTLNYFRVRKNLILTRKNLLFTKQLALKATKEILLGKDRALEIDSIEIKTKEILLKEGKGLYTEKVRRKQLHEIKLLIDHYIKLLNSNKTSYVEMIEAAYQSKKKYLSFLKKLQQIEQGVIQAAVMTVQKGSKKERLIWFRKVQNISRKVRTEEMEKIFP